jgi:L-cysteine/cystine lyase
MGLLPLPELPAIPGREVAGVVDAVGAATRMVAVSHVLWTTGRILSLPEISAAAEAAGASVLVDGAQAGGAIGVDVGASGVDYYAVSGQKWLLGPQGTGALWVHPRRLEELRPVTPSYFTYEGGKVGDVRADAARFDAGSLDPALLAGLAAAVEWVDGLPGGRPAWLELTAARAAEARRRLDAADGVSVDDPGVPTSGLIALRLHDADPVEAVEHLAERGVLVRSIPDTPYLRVSVGPWTSDGDLDALVEGLAELS